MSGGGPLILADVRSTTERRLVAEWAAEHDADAVILVLDGEPDSRSRLAGALSRSDDMRPVQPVRVTWLPRERGSNGRLKLSEMLLLGRPRRPWRPVQEVITRTRPTGVRLTTAAPASVADLRRRFTERYGAPDATPEASARFAAFVGRQAVLACDRADREVLGNRYKVPRLIVEQMVDDPAFATGVEELADRLGQDVTTLHGEVRRSLEELVAVQSQLAIDVWRSLVRPLHARAWRVDVNDAEVDSLKGLDKDHSLIFLFSHRSYVDPLILADVLLEHDLPRNHTIGGANLSFWPFGPLGKRAGLIFIRRRFGDDEAYKFAVRRYLGHLMSKRFNLEWSLEGGRTRTGKLRRPQYGILRYLVDGLSSEPQADPVVIPVSLVYEQLHEVKALAAEEQGGTKKAESLSWFAGYVRAQQQNLGDVLVRFGAPLPLRAALESAGDSNPLEKVAFEVSTRINDVTPATSTSLVCLVLLGERDLALTLEQVQRRVAPLLDYLDLRGIERPKDDLRTSAGLEAVLDRLTEAGVVEVYDGGTTAVWSIHPDRHHTAAFYRNGALHHLLNRAIGELCVLLVASDPAIVDADEQTRRKEVWHVALDLRDLLKFEFFFPDKARFAVEMQEEADRLPVPASAADLADGTLETAVEVLRAASDVSAPAGLLVAHHVLRGFIDAQMVAAEVLVSVGGGNGMAIEELTARGLALGQQLLRQRRMHGAESLSQELIGGAGRLADNRNLLEPGPNVQARREAWRDELQRVTDHLVALERLEHDTRRARLLQLPDIAMPTSRV